MHPLGVNCKKFDRCNYRIPHLRGNALKSLLVVGLTCLFSGFAFADSPLAANMVGYQTIWLQAGWNLMGVSFEDVGRTNGTIKLDTLVDSTKLTSADAVRGTLGDFAVVWDNQIGDYKGVYYYVNRQKSGQAYGSNWVDANSHPVSVSFQLGDAFWLYCCAPVAMAQAGQVSESNQHVALRKGGWSFISTPYPTPVEIPSAQAQLSGLTGYDFEHNAEKDFVLRFDNQTGMYQEALYYVNAPARGYANCWVDASFTPRKLALRPGQAFLLNRVDEGGEAKIDFSSPFSW